jgi:hypothetical protein
MAEVGLRESPREVAAVGVVGSTRVVPPATPERRHALAAGALVVGLATATAAQGGYHGPGRIMLAASLAVAVVLHPWQHHVLRTCPSAPAAALAALAALAVARGLAAGEVMAGVGWAASSASVAAVLILVAALPEATRRTVLDALLIVSALVAASAWAGVVWHVDRLASAQDGVWRGASTLTYANATCALLVTTALVTVARQVDQPGDRVTAVLLCLQVVGVGATASRAGALAAVAGLAVMAVALGTRRVVRATAAPLVGAGIALAGLGGSYALTSPAGRPVAWVALLTGAAATALLARRAAPAPRASRVAARPAGRGVIALVAVVGVIVLVGASVTLAETVRVRAGTGGVRLAAHRAALERLADAPLLGTGPGHDPLVLPLPGVWTLRYVHDEYLETALALGVVGLALLLVAIALLATGLVRSVRACSPRARALPAAALAVLTAATVHAAFDFLWHIPVVPLVVASAVATGVRATTTTTRRGTP